MRNLIRYIFPATIFLLGFSCDKNETVKPDDKCGDNTAKFIRNWCALDDLAVIEILSNKSMGEDWTNSSDGKAYHRAVLAVLDSTLSKANDDWSKVMNPSDSVFYFNYVLEQIVTCKVCCAPTQEISITSFAPRPCPATNN